MRSASPYSVVIRGLDPRIHRPRQPADNLMSYSKREGLPGHLARRRAEPVIGPRFARTRRRFCPAMTNLTDVFAALPVSENRPATEQSGPLYNAVRSGTFDAAGYCLLDSSGETVMTKLGTIGAACLAVALAASSPVLAQGGNRAGGYHAGGAHFAGGGFRGGGRGGVGIAKRVRGVVRARVGVGHT